MSDKLYEEFNNIALDEDEFNSMEESLTEIEIKSLKNNLKKKVYKKNRRHIKMVASIVLTAIVGITLVTPTFAETIGQYIPGLDTLYEKMGYYDEYKDFSQYIGMSKEDKGYTFTIDKLVADDDTVLVALRISKPGLNKDKNDYEVTTSFMMIADLPGLRRGTIKGGTAKNEMLDENTSMVLLENKTAPTKSLPKRFKMSLNIHSTFDEYANVDFDLPVSREKIKKETIIKKNLGESAIGDEIKVNLKQVKVSPINTTIKYFFDGKLENNSSIQFYLYDENGRIYTQNSSTTDTNSGDGINTLNKIDKEAKKLYIIPYLEARDEETENKVREYESLDFHGKFFNLDTKREFDFKEEGKINVYKIEKINDSIKFYYNLKGFKNVINKGYVIQLYENYVDKPVDKVWVSTKDQKLNKLDTNEPDNYCIEYDNIDTKKDYVYSVGICSYLTFTEGSPIEVDLR